MGELFVYSFFFGVLFFFFPIFVSVDGYVDVSENKAWFAVSLYRWLKLIGGYGQLSRDGVAIHITDKKAILIPYSKMADTRKKFEITKGFQLWRFHQIIETGGAEKIYGIFIAATIQSASKATFSVLQTKYPFVSLKNSVLLTQHPSLKLSVQAVTVFNMFIVTLAIIKKVLEAIINWIRKRKLMASWKKQQSS